MTIELINYGTPNKNKVIIEGLASFFSYSTIVAFCSEATGLVCSKNHWSKTTGKFLNEIEPRKEKRVNNEEFNKKLKIAIYSGIIKPILESLATSDNSELRRHSIALLKEIEKPSFEVKKYDRRRTL